MYLAMGVYFAHTGVDINEFCNICVVSVSIISGSNRVLCGCCLLVVLPFAMGKHLTSQELDNLMGWHSDGGTPIQILSRLSDERAKVGKAAPQFDNSAPCFERQDAQAFYDRNPRSAETIERPECRGTRTCAGEID